MKKWNVQHLNQLKREGKIQGYTITEKPKKPLAGPSLKGKSSKALDWVKWNLWYWANEQALEMVEELRFDKDRKFRFDFAFPAIKIAVEYEGIFSEKSGHTTATGYTKDADKYNLAQRLGWKVIRVTALNYKTLITELNHQIAA